MCKIHKDEWGRLYDKSEVEREILNLVKKSHKITFQLQYPDSDDLDGMEELFKLGLIMQHKHDYNSSMHFIEMDFVDNLSNTLDRMVSRE